jgi:hypothetical protein
LPAWLHEGLAMVTVDHLAGKATVKAETLGILADRSQGANPQEGYRALSSDPDSLLYLAVRGYWITRYLTEAQPVLLRAQLVRRQSHEALEGSLAAGMGTDLEGFWSQIDSTVVSQFGTASNR